MSELPKKEVVRTDDYTMYIEFEFGVYWFHCDIRKWSPDVKRAFTKDLNKVQTELNQPLLALVPFGSTKLRKFGLSIKGWEKLKDVAQTDGQTAEIGIRSLKWAV